MMLVSSPACYSMRHPHRRYQCRYPRRSFFLKLLADAAEAESENTKISVTDASSMESKHPKSYVVYQSPNLLVTEYEHYYSLQTDLPGVKSADLKVELAEGGVLRLKAKRTTGPSCHQPQELTRQFVFDETTIDVSNATANLFDGVLEVRLFKKQEDPDSIDKPRGPIEIVVTQGYAPKQDDESVAFNTLSLMDLPGVRPDHVRLHVHQHDNESHYLLLEAERTRLGTHEVVSKTKRMIQVNTKKSGYWKYSCLFGGWCLADCRYGKGSDGSSGCSSDQCGTIGRGRRYCQYCRS